MLLHGQSKCETQPPGNQFGSFLKVQLKFTKQPSKCTPRYLQREMKPRAYTKPLGDCSQLRWWTRSWLPTRDPHPTPGTCCHQTWRRGDCVKDFERSSFPLGTGAGPECSHTYLYTAESWHEDGSRDCSDGTSHLGLQATTRCRKKQAMESPERLRGSTDLSTPWFQNSGFQSREIIQILLL